ncbi:MAG: MarR family winged helix-turn-helix transcriptional regulator [Candidatus Thorarchaeota archaeon]
MKSQKEFGFLIAKIHQISGRIFTKLLKDYEIEINPAQGRIMFALWKSDGISIQELANRTSLGKSTLTSMLDRLESMGYIQRVPSKDDRREILIELTEKDQALQEKYIDVSKKMNDICFNNFSAEELVVFQKYLERLFTNLEEFEKQH